MDQKAKKETTAQVYTLRVFWSAEDGEYVATFDAFPGVSVLDADPAKAATEATHLLDSILDDMRADMKPTC